MSMDIDCSYCPRQDEEREEVPAAVPDEVVGGTVQGVPEAPVVASGDCRLDDQQHRHGDGRQRERLDRDTGLHGGTGLRDAHELPDGDDRERDAESHPDVSAIEGGDGQHLVRIQEGEQDRGERQDQVLARAEQPG